MAWKALMSTRKASRKVSANLVGSLCLEWNTIETMVILWNQTFARFGLTY